MGWLANKLMQRKLPPSWSMRGGASWPLTVALHVRDVYGLSATQPFFVPHLVPEVPEHIPVIGPTGDVALADEWALWFAALVRSRAAIHDSSGLLLEEYSPIFRQAVEALLPAATVAAENFMAAEQADRARPGKANGPIIPNVVLAVEKELGRKAAPFSLEFRVLPVAGMWLHQVAPQLVLLGFEVQSDPAAMHRLLGPVVRALA